MERFKDILSKEEVENEFGSTFRLETEEVKLKYAVALLDSLLDGLGRERKSKNISPMLLIDVGEYDYVPVSIDKFNPKILIDREVEDFSSFADWIKKNYSALIKHWNQEIYDLELAELVLDKDVLAEQEEEIRRLQKELFNESEDNGHANKTI